MSAWANHTNHSRAKRLEVQHSASVARNSNGGWVSRKGRGRGDQHLVLRRILSSHGVGRQAIMKRQWLSGSPVWIAARQV